MGEGGNEVVFDDEGVRASLGAPAADAGAREGLRITRRRAEGHRPRRVKLLSEEVSVGRADAGAARGGADEGGARSRAATHS